MPTMLETLIASRKASIVALESQMSDVVKLRDGAKSPEAYKVYHAVYMSKFGRLQRLKADLAAFQDELGSYGPGGVNEAKKAK